MKTKLAVLWVSCLVAGSFIPLSWKVRIYAHGRYHTLIHFAAFTLSGLVVCRGVKTRRGQIRYAAFLALLGFSLEIAQWRFFGSAVEWADTTSDIAGVAASLVLLALAEVVGKSLYL